MSRLRQKNLIKTRAAYVIASLSKYLHLYRKNKKINEKALKKSKNGLYEFRLSLRFSLSLIKFIILYFKNY